MLAIIGCGNPTRSDDGIGVAVVRRLQDRLAGQPREDVRIFDAGTDGMGVMFLARGATRLILVDAASTGSEPGAIFEVPGAELEGRPTSGLNLHDFRWDHALYTGRQIFKSDFPEDVRVFLIEAERLDIGLELSPAVSAAGDVVVEKIWNAIASGDD